MDSWNMASLAIAIVMGLLGLAGGRLWAGLRSSAARRKRTGKLTTLQADLNAQRLQYSQLEGELHAQRARNFALERELEAMESDWAQSSPTPFSFDAQTFQIERSLMADAGAPQHDAVRIAVLERQVQDLQDLLAKVSSRARTQRSRSPQARPAPAARATLIQDATNLAVEPGS